MKGYSSFFELALKARKDEKYVEYISILQEGSTECDPECIYLLGQCYEYGWYGFNRDEMKASKLYKKNSVHLKSIAKVASRLSSYRCRFNTLSNTIGKRILNSSNHFAKGYCLFRGIGTDKDIKKGFEETLVSAEEGDAEGQYYVADCFENGYGVDEDQTKAYEWLNKSANQGYPLSQYEVAYCFQFGKGVSKDYEKSLYWYRKCFKSYGTCSNLQDILQISKELKECDVDSLINYHLAKCYLNGEEVNEKNEYLSWYFFKKTKEISGKQQLKELEETTFKEFKRLYKVILTVLCIGKFSPYPKEVFVMVAKEILKGIKNPNY